MQDIWNKEGDSINSKKKQLASKIKAEIPRPDVNYDPRQVADKSTVNPINYYDNDDGYWDNFIKEKQEFLSKVPLPKKHIYYKH